MAELLVHDDVVTVSLSAVEKAEALHGDVQVPRAAVVSARMVPDGMDETLPRGECSAAIRLLRPTGRRSPPLLRHADGCKNRDERLSPCQRLADGC